MFTYRIDDELEMRLLEPRHTPMLFALVDQNREYLRQWMPWVDGTQASDDILDFIQRSLNEFAAGEALHTGIWYRGDLVGVIGMFRDADNNMGEIGYWLDESCQGKGIMTRACRAMIGHAFGELGLKRIFLKILAGNTRSCALAKRLGFRHEGILRQSARLNAEYHNLAVYGLLASEWHILHIADAEVWRASQSSGTYTTDSLKTEGFIHCSRAAQVVTVANRFYQGHANLALLRIDPGNVRAEVRYEPPAHPNPEAVPEETEGELFPHIYGPLNIDAVVDVLDFAPNDAGMFTLPTGLA